MINDTWSRGGLELVFAEHPSFVDATISDSDKHLGAAVAVWNASIGLGPRDTDNFELDGIIPWKTRLLNPNTVIVPQLDGCSELHVLLSELLPSVILRHHGILVRIGNAALWPLTVRPPACREFARRTEEAFADLAWGQLARKDQRRALDSGSSLRLLADDSKFWMREAYRIVAEMMRARPKTRMELMPPPPGARMDVLWNPCDESQRQRLLQAVFASPESQRVNLIAQVLRKEVLPEDLSDRRHSKFKEDVERRLHSKRNRIKVIFGEVQDKAIAYDANPLSVDGDFVLRDFTVLLDPEELKIVVLLSECRTQNEIGLEIGESRTTISRKLGMIRQKLRRYLGRAEVGVAGGLD